MRMKGKREVMVRLPFASFPFSIAWLPGGRLLIVSTSDRPLLRREPDGSLVTHADLSRLSARLWNEIVVDGRGNAYINGGSLDLPGQKSASGIIALVAPDGSSRQVADGLVFPNGMAVTPDNSTLIIAESHGQRLTAFMISKRIMDSSVPMSLLADHPNVQFNYFRGGIGSCETEMH